MVCVYAVFGLSLVCVYAVWVLAGKGDFEFKCLGEMLLLNVGQSVRHRVVFNKKFAGFLACACLLVAGSYTTVKVDR